MTERYNRAVNAVSSTDPILWALEINHPDLEDPIRVVNDNADITINGDLYIACGFRLTPPKDSENNVGSATLDIDNATKEIMPFIEQSRGARGATFTMRQVLRSAPDVVEQEITMDLSNLSADNMTLSCELTFTDLLNKTGNPRQYRPDTAPALY